MLQKLSEQISACYDRAAEARRKAEASDDLAYKSDFLELETQWLNLAHTLQFNERLTDFVAANAHGQSKREQSDRNHNFGGELLPRRLFDLLPVAVCSVSRAVSSSTLTTKPHDYGADHQNSVTPTTGSAARLACTGSMDTHYFLLKALWPRSCASVFQ
jgi:hypothetical protein